MSNYPPNVTGSEPEITGDNLTDNDTQPALCERCTCHQEGYCEQLDEFLCQECIALHLEIDIETEIAEHTDDVAVSEKAFEDAMFRTDEDNVYSSVDYDVDVMSYSVTVDELFKQHKRTNREIN